MGNGIFKTLVVAIFLAAAAFLCGSFAADGIKSAIVPILLVIGAFVLIYLGKNCWWLLYLMIPAVTAVRQEGSLYLLLNAVLLLPAVYWLVMTVFGRVKLTWHRVLPIDAVVAVFVAYFVLSWFRHPVYLNILLDRFTVSDNILVGGADYVVCFFATMGYVAISAIPVDFGKFTKVLKIFAWVSLLVGGGIMAQSILYKSALPMEAGIQEGEGARDGKYLGLATPLLTLLLCKYSVWKILFSPWRLILSAIAGWGLCVSGFRSRLLYVLGCMIVTQWLHRKLMGALLLGGGLVCGVILLSQQYSLDFLPYGVKRVLSPLPGIKFDNMRAVKAAQGSTEWRVTMWKWAMNPTTGYIKDYTWGDGFGQRMDDMRRTRYSVIKLSHEEGQQGFARRGLWHSGPITTIHRLGIIGLCIVVVLSLVVLTYLFRVLRALDSIEGRGYIYFALMPIIVGLLSFYAVAGSLQNILKILYPLAMLKICYCHLLKEGKITPWFSKKTYVPLMVRELNGGEAEPKQA